MISYMCRSCGYSYKPKVVRKKEIPSLCPACGRTGSLIESEGLINKFLKDASLEK